MKSRNMKYQVETRNRFADLLNSLGLIGEAAEIGVFEGEYSQYLLDNWNGTMLHLVDPWKQLEDYDDPPINLSDDVQETRFLGVIERLKHLEARYRIHRKRSCEAARMFQDYSLDFVYIDANHDYEHVREDLKTWFPKVSRNGIFAGHDYIDGNGTTVFGVIQAVNEFAIKHRLEVQTTTADWPSWFFVLSTTE